VKRICAYVLISTLIIVQAAPVRCMAPPGCAEASCALTDGALIDGPGGSSASSHAEPQRGIGPADYAGMATARVMFFFIWGIPLIVDTALRHLRRARGVSVPGKILGYPTIYWDTFSRELDYARYAGHWNGEFLTPRNILYFVYYGLRGVVGGGYFEGSPVHLIKGHLIALERCITITKKERRACELTRITGALQKILTQRCFEPTGHMIPVAVLSPETVAMFPFLSSAEQLDLWSIFAHVDRGRIGNLVDIHKALAMMLGEPTLEDIVTGIAMLAENGHPAADALLRNFARCHVSPVVRHAAAEAL